MISQERMGQCKDTWHVYFTTENISDGTKFDVAMVTVSAPVSFLFISNLTIFDLTWPNTQPYLHNAQVPLLNYSKHHSRVIEIWNRVCCHSNIKIFFITFLGVTSLLSFNCIAQFFSEIFLILCFELQTSQLVTSSVPNLHNRDKLNNSGNRKDILKKNSPSFFVLKGLSTNLGFQYLVFSFHRHVKTLFKKAVRRKRP